jgi:hypothetical protein
VRAVTPLPVAGATTDRTPWAVPRWSFTFPVGTLVTGPSALAKATGLDVLAWTAFGLYIFLLLAWVTVFTATTLGALSGRLLRPEVAQLSHRSPAMVCAQPRRSRRPKMTNPAAEMATAQAARTVASPPSIPWTRAMLSLYGYQKLSLANHASDASMGRNTAST